MLKKLYCDFRRSAKHVNAQRILATRGVSVRLSVSLSVHHMLVLGRLEINERRVMRYHRVARRFNILRSNFTR